jgi:polysaccharide lyase-like protein
MVTRLPAALHFARGQSQHLVLRLFLAILSTILLIGGLPDRPALAQSSLEDEFDDHELKWRYWCPCQINVTEAPLEFLPDPDQSGDGILRITVNDASLGGNVCRYTSINECDPRAGSPHSVHYDKGNETSRNKRTLTQPTAWVGPGSSNSMEKLVFKDPYCTEEVVRSALAAGEENLCIQRQELRFQKPYQHEADKPYLYSFRFRMPAHIEDRKHSIRWVIAQWKQEPLNDSYKGQFEKGEGPSPFLAQRFDDGVLHVTVQDEYCRCKVASAPNPDGSQAVWKDGPAQYCEWTKPAGEGRRCQADLQVKYGAKPILPSALGEWVEMSYRVEASRSGKAFIEVYANG